MNSSQSAIRLSDESRRNFDNSVKRYQRERERRQMVGAVFALLMTYGLVIYFAAETIIKALL